MLLFSLLFQIPFSLGFWSHGLVPSLRLAPAFEVLFGIPHPPVSASRVLGHRHITTVPTQSTLLAGLRHCGMGDRAKDLHSSPTVEDSHMRRRGRGTWEQSGRWTLVPEGRLLASHSHLMTPPQLLSGLPMMTFCPWPRDPCRVLVRVLTGLWRGQEAEGQAEAGTQLHSPGLYFLPRTGPLGQRKPRQEGQGCH